MPKLRILDSGRIMCEMYIKPYNTSLMKATEFKVDTGADFSTISKDALFKLGYTTNWVDKNKIPSNRPITVASGEEVESYYIKLPVINIYGVEGKDYPFGILMDKKAKLPKLSCNGCKYTEAKKLDYRLLLGNDILSCFNLGIDWDNRTVNFEPRANLDTRNKVYQDRQLNLVEIGS